MIGAGVEVAAGRFGEEILLNERRL
jgi:hypothetical protein